MQSDCADPHHSDDIEPSDSRDLGTTDFGVKLWCYCRQDENFDYLIGCDNSWCQIQWFHLSCVKMTMDDVPDGDWFCPDCCDNSNISN